MSLAEKLTLTAEEYLQGEETAEFKHEYLDGEVWAMVGATDAHVTIAMNLAYLLRQKLKGTPCRAYISDMKVNVEKANAFFYPDILVTCDNKDRQNSLYKQQPLFIGEVLSSSTEAFDRGKKFTAYRQLDSLQSYWLIDTNALHIDSYTRTENNDWLLHSYSHADETVKIAALNLEFLLQELYEDTLVTQK